MMPESRLETKKNYIGINYLEYRIGRAHTQAKYTETCSHRETCDGFSLRHLINDPIKCATINRNIIFGWKMRAVKAHFQRTFRYTTGQLHRL